MKLTELKPVWLHNEAGIRIGFMFISPTNPKCYQSCFFSPTPFRQQCEAFWRVRGGDDDDRECGFIDIQPCNSSQAWTANGDVTSLEFETISVTPSLDGSAGGNWHGFITAGQIVGGL